MNESLEIVAQTFRDAEFAYPPTPTAARGGAFLSANSASFRHCRVRHQPQNSSDVIPTGRLFSEADKSLDRGPDIGHGANFGQNLRDLPVPQSIAQAVRADQIDVARLDAFDPGIWPKLITRFPKALVDLVAERMVAGVRFADLALLAQPAHR